jgi:hypothetical protein
VNDDRLASRIEGAASADALRAGLRNGWRQIVETAVDMVAATAPDATIVKIKEKLGDLRICGDAPPEASLLVDLIIAAAETEATRICEICKESGTLCKEVGWRATRCPKHTTPHSGDAVQADEF